MRILLVEDEDHLRDIIQTNLEMEGYEVVGTASGHQAIEFSKEQHFDLIVLDIMLPDISGLDICEQIRLENFNIPIIFVSARDTAHDRIVGLKRGGDDYLSKPFNLEELLLRIDKLIKRSQNTEGVDSETYTFGSNQINLKTFQAIGRSGTFQLTKKEAKLLKLFIDRRNEVVSRQQILQAVWGYDVYPSTRTIDNFILSFRKYFEEDPRKPRFFQSVRGVGYRFVGSPSIL